jgi:glycosyltransferase involved in cell wall biosynthesis
LQKTNSLAKKSIIYPAEAKTDPLVSVVITTKNEEKNIENCLRSIKGQTFKNIELIVVDNFSKDKTAEIAKKYAAKVCLKGPERSSQRNYGAQVASGEYLLYLDADMILSPNVIEKCVEKCEIDRVDALYVPERIVGEGFWIKVRDFERSFYTGTVIDAVRFIRKELFEKVGGFDENLVGPEDWDFDRKIRKISITGIASMPLYHNEGRFNIKRYLKKKSYYSSGIKNYVKKWGPNNSETLKQMGVQYRLMGVFVEKGKWKKLLRHPLFMIAMYYLRFRVAVGYLESKRTLKEEA